MLFAQLEESSHGKHDDHRAGDEIAPGVFIRRRQLLRFGIGLTMISATAGMAALLSQLHFGTNLPSSRTKRSASPKLNLDEVLNVVRPLARQLVTANDGHEEPYLDAVAALLARLARPAAPETGWYYPGDGLMANRIRSIPPIEIFEVHMAPHTRIPLHDHRHFNSVVAVQRGAMRVRQFDIVQPQGQDLQAVPGEVPPKGAEFLIKTNRDEVVELSGLSTLSRDRDNIHLIEAGPDGCELIDLFTLFRPEARSYELAWDGKPFDRSGTVYKVAWKEG